MAFSRASRVMSDVGTICVMPALLNNVVGSFNQNAVMMGLRVACIYTNGTIIYILI